MNSLNCAVTGLTLLVAAGIPAPGSFPARPTGAAAPGNPAYSRSRVVVQLSG